MLAFSQSAENNKQPIGDKFTDLLANASHLLEIGSGTGQHATYMAQKLPHLIWQPSELAENLPNLQARLDAEAPKNVKAPFSLDVANHPWPLSACDVIYSANTVHIMSWTHVKQLFHGVGEILAPNGLLCLYGPYKYQGTFTTPSNEKFDNWLKQRDANSGIRNFEDMDQLAAEQGLVLQNDFAMPANNQLLVWQRRANHEEN